MSSENTYYSTVRIQDSTRFIVEDSIVLVMEPQIFIEPQIFASGFSDVFRLKQDAKITKPRKQQRLSGCYRVV